MTGTPREKAELLSKKGARCGRYDESAVTTPTFQTSAPRRAPSTDPSGSEPANIHECVVREASNHQAQPWVKGTNPGKVIGQGTDEGGRKSARPSRRKVGKGVTTEPGEIPNIDQNHEERWIKRPLFEGKGGLHWWEAESLTNHQAKREKDHGRFKRCQRAHRSRR